MTMVNVHKERLRIARRFIDHHYDTRLTVRCVSAEAGFSPYHFIRLFRAAYKQTPHQYLVRRRIEKAKELLCSSTLSVHEICFAVGFESLGSFSTLFRREVGLSPSAYRQRAHERLHTPEARVYVPLCHRVMRGIEDWG